MFKKNKINYFTPVRSLMTAVGSKETRDRIEILTPTLNTTSVA